MTSPASEPFRAVLRSLVGANGPNCAPVLSSLWCELVFNDARDAERRGNKKEEVTPVQCHAVATKSVVNRAGKIQKQEPICLTDADWAVDLPGKTLKASVFQSSRLTDAQLGLDTSAMSHKRTNPEFTKPHIFMQRLCLMRHLVKKYHSAKEDNQDFDVGKEVSTMWVNQLFRSDFFLTFPGQEDQSQQLLIIGSNPYSILCYKLCLEGDVWVPAANDSGVNQFVELCVSERDFACLKVSDTQPCVCDNGLPKLGWKQKGEWKNMSAFVCEYLIHTISATLLSALCRLLKIRGYSKVCHRERCELFLGHCGYSDEWIAEVMLLIPEKPPRKANQREEGWSFKISCVEHRLARRKYS